MKKYHLIIGDNSELLADVAKLMFSDSILITQDTYNDFFNLPNKSGYTSLADLNRDQILTLAKNATEIHYQKPLYWNSIEFEQATQQFLTELVIHHNLKIRNFGLSTDSLNILNLIGQKQSSSPQIWNVGCSYAHGWGLESSHERYIDKISNTLNLEVTDLTSPGSSIDWAADQILRSDIGKNDLVVWGITGINRTSYYIDNQYVPIVPTFPEFFGKFTSDQKKFFNRLLVDDNRLVCAIKHVHQVINFVQKIQADIVLFYHRDLGLLEHSTIFETYLYNTGHYVKTTSKLIDHTDDGHPGPKSNQIWANEILNHLYKHYPKRFNHHPR